jgi:hypothetical protein
MSQSSLEDWIKEKKLDLAEKIMFYYSYSGGHPKPNRCEYDSSSFELYKKYRKRDVPEGAKDLGLIEWYIFGKCPKCGRKDIPVTHYPNSYLW